MTKPEIIFFGNGPLADYSLDILEKHCDIIYHAQTRDDLETVKQLKQAHPHAFGILASFGVLIKPDLLELFQPVGILNLHPSLLPKLRGASPIESAILAGDTDFSYSIMQLAPAMDAGPIYHQATLSGLPLDKLAIYRALAEAGSLWLIENLPRISKITPIPQDNSAATFCGKLDKSLSFLDPAAFSATEVYRQIIAYQGFPKPKYSFLGHTCIILAAHIVDATDAICDITSVKNSPLMLRCADRNFVAIDCLQPEGKKPMDAQSFMNGYSRNR